MIDYAAEILAASWPTNAHALMEPHVENLDVQAQAPRLFEPPIFCSPPIGLVTTERGHGVVRFQTLALESAPPQDPAATQ